MGDLQDRRLAGAGGRLTAPFPIPNAAFAMPGGNFPPWFTCRYCLGSAAESGVVPALECCLIEEEVNSMRGHEHRNFLHVLAVPAIRRGVCGRRPKTKLNQIMFKVTLSICVSLQILILHPIL